MGHPLVSRGLPMRNPVGIKCCPMARPWVYNTTYASPMSVPCVAHGSPTFLWYWPRGSPTCRPWTHSSGPWVTHMGPPWTSRAWVYSACPLVTHDSIILPMGHPHMCPIGFPRVYSAAPWVIRGLLVLPMGCSWISHGFCVVAHGLPMSS